MNIDGELDPMLEHKTQFNFKDKSEHIANVNMMPNLGKTHSIANNVGRLLLKKIVSMIDSKQIDKVNNSDIYGKD